MDVPAVLFPPTVAVDDDDDFPVAMALEELTAAAALLRVASPFPPPVPSEAPGLGLPNLLAPDWPSLTRSGLEPRADLSGFCNILEPLRLAASPANPLKGLEAVLNSLLLGWKKIDDNDQPRT